MVGEWRRSLRERRELERLSDRELRDIGLNHADVWRETRKPLWRALMDATRFEQ